MFRFSIRELMLLTLVVALFVGWAIDHWRTMDSHLKAMIKSEIKSEAMETKLKIEGYEVVQDGKRVRIFSKTEPDKVFFTGPAPNWRDANPSE